MPEDNNKSIAFVSKIIVYNHYKKNPDNSNEIFVSLNRFISSFYPQQPQTSTLKPPLRRNEVLNVHPTLLSLFFCACLFSCVLCCIMRTHTRTFLTKFYFPILACVRRFSRRASLGVGFKRGEGLQFSIFLGWTAGWAHVQPARREFNDGDHEDDDDGGGQVQDKL